MIRVPSFGPRSARIVAVGEAPGVVEEKEGRPFVGPAGDLFRKFLMQVGIDPDEIFFANICMFRPPANKLRSFFSDSGEPNSLVVDGLISLQRELFEIRPHVVMALGNYPLWALTGKTNWRKVDRPDGQKEFTYAGITDWRGSILDCTLVKGLKVIPTYHPSYILREGMADHGAWLCDLERVKREAQFPEIRRPRIDIEVAETATQQMEARNWLLEDRSAVLTTDIEYVGSKLICVGMTTRKDRAVVVPIKKAGDISFCKSILLSGMGISGQNLIYDASILEWHFDMPIMQRVVYDTILAAHATQPELPKSLDYLTSIHTDIPFYKNMVNWKLIKEGKQDLNIVYEYNGLDVIATHTIRESQLTEDLTDPAVMSAFQFELALLRPLWEMAKRGVRIDQEKLEAYRIRLDNEIELKNGALDVFSGRPINVKSNADIKWLFFEYLGLKPGKINKTGPATDDKTIASIQAKLSKDTNEYKIIQLVRVIRSKRDLISKFVDIQFDKDGRMRGHYDPAGTKTWRLNSRKFYPTDTGGNQQNIPTEREVRQLFLPDRDCAFCYFDLERAESLVVAHLADDPLMLADHAPGVDAHRRLASRLFGVTEASVTKIQRNIWGKQTRHAGNYLEGPRTMMLNINQKAAKTGVTVTEAECKLYLGKYKDESPGLRRYWDDVKSQLYVNRTITNLIGFKRQFFGHIGSILPEAVAHGPQSTVGCVLNLGILNLSGTPFEYVRKNDKMEEIWEAYEITKEANVELLMQVHDAVAFQLKITMDTKNFERALRAVQRLLTIPLWSPKRMEWFSISVEAQIGPTWGDVETWNGDGTQVRELVERLSGVHGGN